MPVSIQIGKGNEGCALGLELRGWSERAIAVSQQEHVIDSRADGEIGEAIRIDISRGDRERTRRQGVGRPWGESSIAVAQEDGDASGGILVASQDQIRNTVAIEIGSGYAP